MSVRCGLFPRDKEFFGEQREIFFFLLSSLLSFEGFAVERIKDNLNLLSPLVLA